MVCGGMYLVFHLAKIATAVIRHGSDSVGIIGSGRFMHFIFLVLGAARKNVLVPKSILQSTAKGFLKRIGLLLFRSILLHQAFEFPGDGFESGPAFRVVLCALAH